MAKQINEAEKGEITLEEYIEEYIILFYTFLDVSWKIK
jgi:hypothetical protein